MQSLLMEADGLKPSQVHVGRDETDSGHTPQPGKLNDILLAETGKLVYINREMLSGQGKQA